MAKNYYAVKKGRHPGIYTDWESCQAEVTGFSGAQFKGFALRSEAEEYLNRKIRKKPSTAKKKTQANEPVITKDTLVAYVDGSYNKDTQQFSYGMVLLHDGNQECVSKQISDPSLASMHNVAGEIKGAEAAMRYAIKNGYRHLVIYHDYNGIAEWCVGGWKTNRAGTKAYKEFYDSIKDVVHIQFVKVKGHSGDTYNDMADELAKSAIF